MFYCDVHKVHLFDSSKLVYRSSINPDVFERCRRTYNHFFDELDRLGPMDAMLSVANNAGESQRKQNMRTRPVSGVRGIYYTRGTWRVAYRIDTTKKKACMFSFNSKESLIATFDLAYRFLMKVVELGRQLRRLDGSIIGKITVERLIDLERRANPAKASKGSPIFSDETPLYQDEYFAVPNEDHDSYDDGYDDEDLAEESDAYVTPPPKRRRRCTLKEKVVKPDDMSFVEIPSITSEFMVEPPNLEQYLGKLSNFELIFQSYSPLGTYDMISLLMDKECAERMGNVVSKNSSSHEKEDNSLGDMMSQSPSTQFYDSSSREMNFYSSPSTQQTTKMDELFDIDSQGSDGYKNKRNVPTLMSNRCNMKGSAVYLNQENSMTPVLALIDSSDELSDADGDYVPFVTRKAKGEAEQRLSFGKAKYTRVERPRRRAYFNDGHMLC